MSDEMIEQARHIVAGDWAVLNIGCCPRWAEALLAEHAATVRAERERDRLARKAKLLGEPRMSGDPGWLADRVATLEAALRELVDVSVPEHIPSTRHHLAIEAGRAALGDQEPATNQ